MRKLFIAPLYIFVIMIALSSPVQSEESISKALPKLYAVTFYADWCGNCKRLDPELEKAKALGQWNESQIQFVTFDLTDKVRIGKAVADAKDSGLWSVLQSNGAKTGSIALVEGGTNKEITRFYAGDTANEIRMKIDESLML